MGQGGRALARGELTEAPPSNPSGRLEVLDVARGVAILGIFAVNVLVFAGGGGLYGLVVYEDPEANEYITTGSLPVVLLTVLTALTSGKFLALLMLVFGAGLELQRRASQREGRAWPGRYLLLTAVLFLDGIVHFLLVFEFDVLMSYAVAALVVAVVAARSPRFIRVATVVAAALHAAVTVAVAILLETVFPAMGTVPLADAESYAVGSYLDQVELRLEHFGVLRGEAIFIVPMSVLMFLVGLRLLGAGALAPDRTGRRLRRRLLLVGGVALVLSLATAFVPSYAAYTALRYGLSPFVAVGYLALVGALVHAARAGWLRRRLAEVGRIALSGYVLQGVLGGLLFYAWGLNLLRRVTSEWDLLLYGALGWLAVNLVVVAFAHVWLRWFRRGPVEWTWRWLALRLASQAPRAAGRARV